MSRGIGERWGKYELISRLGRGGMGEVFLARHIGPSGFERAVVLKRVLPHLGDDRRLIDMFVEEARLTARLQHPNIVQLFELGEDRGEYFAVMEYIDGRQLNDVIQQLSSAPMPVGLGAFVIREVCRALSYASELPDAGGTRLGLVHRDVSPSNIMLGYNGSVKLLDFGIAKSHASEDTTETGLLKGKLWYLPPERLAGMPSDHRGDLFAAGVVLHEALTGQRLFPAQSYTELEEMQRLPPPPPSKANPAVPPALDRICARALAFDPAARFATGNEMADALDEVLFDLKWGTRHVAALMTALPTDSQRAPVPSSDGDTAPTVIEAGAPALASGRRASPRPVTPVGAASSVDMPLPKTPTTGTPLPATTLPTPAPATPATGWRRHRWVLAVAVAALAPLLVTAARLRPERSKVAAATAPAAERRALVVLGFQNLSGRPETTWLSTALTEMLVSELGQTRKLRLLSGEQVARMKAELGVREADVLAKDSLARIRDNLGADLVLLGSYTALADGARPLRLDLKVQDARGGETVAAVAKAGTEGELFSLVDFAGAELRRQLGIEAPQQSERVAARTVLPSSLEAARLYSEGLARLRVWDAPAASELLQQAVAADPGHAPSHSALASAWQRMGYDRRAEDEAKRALALAEHAALSPSDRLWIEGTAYMIRHDWSKAIATYQTLVDFVPDSLDYGLHLAQAQMRGGQPEAALATVRALRKLPLPDGDDARIDLIEAQQTREAPSMLALTERAQKKAEARGAWLLVAEAKRLEAAKRGRAGECDRAMELAKEARRIFARAGDFSGSILTGQTMGECFDIRGDFAAALRVDEEMGAMAERLGDRHAQAEAEASTATSLSKLGRLTEAIPHFERAIALDSEIDDRQRRGTHLNNFADMRLRIGELADAKQMIDQAVADERAVSGKLRLALALGTRAEVAMALGDLTTARLAQEESVRLVRAIGDRRMLSELLLIEAALRRVRGEPDEARARLAEVQTLAEAIKEPALALAAKIQLADLALDDGQAAVAEGLLSGVKSGSGLNELVTAAHVTLARARLRQDHVEAARQALADAEEDTRASKLALFEPAIGLALVRGQLAAATGARPQAKRILEAALADTRRLRHVELELEVRLALAAWAAGATNATGRGTETALPGAARAQLAALAKSAEDRGFVRVARLARAQLH